MDGRGRSTIGRPAIPVSSCSAGAGTPERVTQGAHRLRRFPAQRFEDVVVACLWAGEDAVASHDTALSVHGLTDVMPTFIHITVPRPFRGRRAGVVVHRAELAAGDRTERDGVPETTVTLSIADVHERSGPDLTRAAPATSPSCRTLRPSSRRRATRSPSPTPAELARG